MRFKIFAAAVAVTALAASAQAKQFVVNGGFESTTAGTGQLGYNTDATGWSTTGYNFLFAGNTADDIGANGQYGNLKLWGPDNGSANGLAQSPNGGNYLAADGAFQQAPITQTLTGLRAGNSYTVAFSWAGAQQLGFDGVNTEQWEVQLGGAPAQFTDVYVNPNHGFSGWTSESFTFVATGATQVLSFLAHGTPNGVPPFSLLDGVSVNGSVPEPATWAMMLAGFGLVGFAARRRAASASVAA